MDYLTFFSEVIEAVSWPLAIIAVCFILKTPIENLLGRLQEATHKDTSFRFGTNQQSGVSISPGSQVADAVPQDNLGLIADGEKLVLELFERQGIESDSDRLKVLLKHFVNNQMRYGYAHAERYIFGSQIALLHALNVAPAECVEEEYLRSFYEGARAQYPNEYVNYDFQSWLNFLKTNGLINSKDGNHVLTLRGRGFLAYLTESGINLSRPF
jgi:hypothetical protein